jgi:hypothetical protein
LSRAINLNLTHDEVQAGVAKHKAVISSIEPLFPKGTRVVLTNADQAATLRRVFKTKVIEGPVVRTPLRTGR